MTSYYKWTHPDYNNLREQEKKLLQQMAEQIDRIVMDHDIPGQQWANEYTGVEILDAETAALILAEDIECEIINDKPIAL